MYRGGGAGGSTGLGNIPKKTFFYLFPDWKSCKCRYPFQVKPGDDDRPIMNVWVLLYSAPGSARLVSDGAAVTWAATISWGTMFPGLHSIWKNYKLKFFTFRTSEEETHTSNTIRHDQWTKISTKPAFLWGPRSAGQVPGWCCQCRCHVAGHQLSYGSFSTSQHCQGFEESACYRRCQWGCYNHPRKTGK